MVQRRIVVIGASKEIGRASADLLAENGWAVNGIAWSRPEHSPVERIEVDLTDIEPDQHGARERPQSSLTANSTDVLSDGS